MAHRRLGSERIVDRAGLFAGASGCRISAASALLSVRLLLVLVTSEVLSRISQEAAAGVLGMPAFHYGPVREVLFYR
jgi:hypothetical protein